MSDSKVRVILIDPENKTVKEAYIEAQYEAIRKYVGGYIENAIDYTVQNKDGGNRETLLYINEEGRIQQDTEAPYPVFQIDKISLGSLAGKGIIIDYNNESEEYMDTKISIEQVRNNIVFAKEYDRNCYCDSKEDIDKIMKWNKEIHERIKPIKKEMREFLGEDIDVGR